MIAPSAFSASVAIAKQIAAAPTESKLFPPRTVEVNAKPVLHTRAANLAVAVSVDQTIAMARALAALDEAAWKAVALLVARSAYLASDTMRAEDAAQVGVDEAFAALAEAMAALGYVTLKDPEKTDGNAG